MPRPRRSFPADFKAPLALELLTGTSSQAELCRKHNVKPQLLGDWKATALDRFHTLFQEDPQVSKGQLRIAERFMATRRMKARDELKIWNALARRHPRHPFLKHDPLYSLTPALIDGIKEEI